MSEITQATVWKVGDLTFDTREEAVAHVRRENASGALVELLHNSDIDWRETCALVFAEWICNHWHNIREAVEKAI